MITSPGSFLALAIGFEVAATLSLKASNGFSNLPPAIGSACGYLVSFYFMSLALRSIPVGTAYAIWSGVGIVLLMLAHAVETGRLDMPGMAGAMLILAGIVCINLYSEAT